MGAESATGAPRARRGLKVAFYAVLVLAVAAVAGFGLRSIYASPSTAAGGVARTVTVQRGIVQESVTASGNISPAIEANENFTASGTVTAVNVAVGGHVKAGQVLATIDPSTARANLATAAASLQSAEAALQQARQGGSASQLAQNNSQLMSARAQLSSDQQQLTSDQSTLATAKTQLATDEQLGCPAASSSSSTGTNSTGSTGTSSTGSTGTSSTGSSGSGSSGSTTTTTVPSTTGSTGSTGTSSAATTTTPATTTTTTIQVPTTTTALSTMSMTTATSSSHDVSIFDAGSDTVTAPAVATSSAASITTTTATLEGSVDPGNGETTYFFQYGTSTIYGVQTVPATLDAGSTTVSVSASIRGLKATTSYVFRLVASNSEGTSYGLPQYLVTATGSCVTDRETITTDEQAVQNEKQTIQLQQASLVATKASQAIDTTTVTQDQQAVTEDQQTVTTDESALAGTTLTASISGTVTAVSGTVGETVSGGSSSSTAASNSSAASAASSSSSSSSGFVTIDNLKDLEVVAGFAEADATKIAVGQPATVTLAALPSTELVGVVAAISPTSVVSSNVVTYDETIALKDPPATVLDGMTADVSVVVETATNTLEVPSAAVTTTGVSSTVTVLKNAKDVTTPVTVGLVGNSTTQILSGVTAGEKLVEPTATVSSSGTTGTTTPTRTFGGGGGGFGGAGGFG